MFEISQLKEKKLPELHEIAKELKVPKFKSLKKMDLVYQILDLQATDPTIVTPEVANKSPRPRRERISKPTKESNTKASPAIEKAAPIKEVVSKNKSPKAKVETKTTGETETNSENKGESNGTSKINPRPQKQKNQNPNQKHNPNQKNPNQKNNPNQKI